MRMRAPSLFLLAVAASVANGGRNGSVIAFRSSPPPSFAVRRNNKPHRQQQPQQQRQARRTGLPKLRLVPSQQQQQQQHPYHLRTKRASLLVLKENYVDDADSEKDEDDDGDEEAFEEFAKTTLSTDEDDEGGGETIKEEADDDDDGKKASATPTIATSSGINGDAASGGGGGGGRPVGGRNSVYTTGAAAAAAARAARTTTTSSAASDPLPFLELLQSLGAITCRGEFADARQRTTAEKCISSLESGFAAETQRADASMLQGTWELVYSTTPNLFRSSPFFMAGRAVCTTPDAVDQYNFFCDMHRKALAVSTIKSIRQVISRDKLVSEFEVTAGVVPFLSDFTPFSYSGGLPVTVDGAIVSSADIESVGRSGPIDDDNDDKNALDVTLYMDTVEIKGSNVPGLRQVLDAGLKLQSRQLAGMLEQVASNDAVPFNYETPRPVFRTTYLTETFRISRDQDGHAFLYVKTSPDASPTDYSSVDSDLGLAKLLEKFNDAVTKFYL